jgi:sigma-B regulation protein RsbQ
MQILLDVCDTLQLKDAVLVGHSAGAMIGMLSSIRAPESFSKMVLIGASPRYLNDADYYGGFADSDVRDIYLAIQQDHWNWAASFSAMAMQNLDKPQLAEHFAETIRDITADQVLAVLHSILQSDYRDMVSGVKVPTLIIQSQNDPFVPLTVAEYLHERIHGSQLEIIQAFGHLPHISSPEAVISAITNFI